MTVDGWRAREPGGRMANRLVRALGWFSLGLGTAQLGAPGAVSDLIGAPDDEASRSLHRVVGLREVTAGGGLLSRSRPVGWLWTRVAGDAMDMTLLFLTLRSPRSDRNRVTKAIAAVAGITAVDLVTALRMTRAKHPAEAGDLADRYRRATAATTVKRPIEDVYLFWHDFENLPRFMSHLQEVHVIGDKHSRWKAKAPAGQEVEWEAAIVGDTVNEHIAWRSLDGAKVENSGSVHFAPAPGDQGTEVAVDVRYLIPGGAVGSAISKLFGEEPGQQIADDLRRFKQVMEAGEVVRSEGSPEGVSTYRLLRQRPARPLP